MDSIVIFLIKSVIVSGMLASWYWVGLRNKRQHNYNRFYLLFALYASIQVPLLHFQWFAIHADGSKALYHANALLHGISDTRVSSVESQQANTIQAINWQYVVLAVSVLVTAILLSILVFRIIMLLKIKHRYPNSRIGNVAIINTDLPSAPFSFLRLLFWKDTIDRNSANGQLIYKHELAHIQQGHTYDKLACQLLTCICWFNPFYWLIEKELGMLHEFIADEAAINDNDTEAFACMLLQTHNSGSYLVPEHQFFSSPVKRRLIMLQKTNKVSHAGLRRFMVLPLMAGAVLIFSFSPVKAKKDVVKADRKLVLVLDPGHGGADEGAEYLSVKEKNVNLRIARRLEELAPRYNIETHLTRDGDTYPTLQQRVDISNKIHPDGFISLHVTDDAARDMHNGNFDIAICFENPKAEQSKQLGWAVYHHITAQGGVLKKDPTEKRAYVLRYNDAPSILLEFGDIKNEQQMQWINNDAKLDELCSAVLAGVVDANKN